MFCNQFHMSTKMASIQCPPGLRIKTSNAVFGILSTNINQATHCHQHSVDEEIRNPVTEHGIKKILTNCTKFLDTEKVSHLLDKHCINKNKCTLPLIDILDPQFKGSATTLNNGECGDDAYFFLQAPCLFPSTQFVWR